MWLNAAPGPPAVYERPIPSVPTLVGRTFSMQARIDSAAAPSGAAWSNPISFIDAR